MNDGRKLPNKLHSRILRTILKEKGVKYVTCNFVLTEDFIQSNADYISGDHDWIQILVRQKHINPKFFDQFRADMGPGTIILLDYRKSVIGLEKILEAINARNF